MHGATLYPGSLCSPPAACQRAQGRTVEENKQKEQQKSAWNIRGRQQQQRRVRACVRCCLRTTPAVRRHCPDCPAAVGGRHRCGKKTPHPKALGLCNVFGVSLPPFSEHSDPRTLVKLTEFHMLNRSLNLLHLSLSTRVHVCLLQTCLNRGQYFPQEARLNLWEFGGVPPLSSRPQACGRIYRPTLAFSLSLSLSRQNPSPPNTPM